MSRFSVQQTEISGVARITRKQIKDSRGYLERLYDKSDLSDLIAGDVVQINRTVTDMPGTVRGLHTQMPPCAETKLVTCVSGSVFDVAVDLRRDSTSFGKWFGTVLSAQNKVALVIPPGCAHGFQTLEPGSELIYIHTAPHIKDLEAGLNPLNDEIGISWPLPLTALSVRDSHEDRGLDFFREVMW